MDRIIHACYLVPKPCPFLAAFLKTKGKNESLVCHKKASFLGRQDAM